MPNSLKQSCSELKRYRETSPAEFFLTLDDIANSDRNPSHRWLAKLADVDVDAVQFEVQEVIEPLQSCLRGYLRGTKSGQVNSPIDQVAPAAKLYNLLAAAEMVVEANNPAHFQQLSAILKPIREVAANTAGLSPKNNVALVENIDSALKALETFRGLVKEFQKAFPANASTTSSNSPVRRCTR